MGCRPVRASSVVLLSVLLLLLGRGAKAQQDVGLEAPLEDEYPGLVQDYPEDMVDYFGDIDYTQYYIPFSPDVRNTTLRKCRCEGDQVWDGKQCQDVATLVAIIDIWTGKQVILNTSAFHTVDIGDVNCTDGKKKVVLNSNRKPAPVFSLLEFGGLFWKDLNFSDYCIDHILDPKGQPNSWEAHLCLPPPPVSLCCPSGHAIHSNGTCYPEDAASNVPLSMEVEGQEVTWQMGADNEVINITCSHADTYYRRLDEGNLSLVYNPRGAVLQWLPPTITNPPMGRQEYCLGVEMGGDGQGHYSTLFCYKDHAVAHRETCYNATCVRKCCADGYFMVEVNCMKVQHASQIWRPNFHHVGSLTPGASPPEDFIVVHGYPICDSFFKMRPDESEEDRFYLLEDGSLYVPVFSSAYPATHYCIDSFISKDHPLQEHPLVCFKDKNLCHNVQSMAYPALLAVSCVFLAITLLVYVSVPELHAKVHGKCLVSHVTALLFAYLCLIVVQWSSGRLPDFACKIMASLTHVSFLAAFFWLNVMCFDIWWTLKSMRPVAETGELSRLRFKMYSVYSWGCPVLISLVAIIMQSLPEDMDVIRPNFGMRKCWFDDNKTLWAYFYGFVLVLVVANIIFFCQVAYILIMAQNDPILQRTRQQNRERMWLYIKLFLVMGLTWITEVISWQEGSCEAWIIPDIINALQGFSIFLIFICKKNMIKRIRTNWEPYLRRMKQFFGSSRQPQATKGKGVQDTSSFTSSVNRPSHSNASQRTVQSQISLDPTSASRKFSTSSLVSTTGVQIHPTNSLCMDTITEASTPEGEEEKQEEDSQDTGEAPALGPSQDAPAVPQSDVNENTHDYMESKEPVKNRVGGSEDNKLVIHVPAAPIGNESTEVDTTQKKSTAQALTNNGTVQSESDTFCSEGGDDSEAERMTLQQQYNRAIDDGGDSEVERMTPQQQYNKASDDEGDSEGQKVTPQQHYNRAFVTEDIDDQPIQV